MSHFWNLYDVFCKTLPSIICSVIDATRTCKILYEKVENDLTRGLVYNALDTWFHKDRHRYEECLTLIRDNIDFHAYVTTGVLLTVAKHDLATSAELALSLSRQQEQRIRLESLHSLGRMSIKDNQRVLEQTFARFEEVIDSPLSDEEASVVTCAALSQYGQIGDSLADKVTPLLRNVCNNPTPNTVHAIAVSLLLYRKHYTAEMLDLSFSIIQCVKKQDQGTLKKIDQILDEWDIDTDRERILIFLRGLLCDSDDSIEISALESFVQKNFCWAG